jgi:hypothetical protein
MSEPERAQSTIPYIVAAVLVVVAAALTVLVVHVYSVRDQQSKPSGARYGPTPDQYDAVQAAATEAANLTTYTRAHFDTDFARALKGATGALESDVAKNKSKTLEVMNQGKFDLSSKVVESAFESASGNKVLVLVTLNGSHVFGGGKTPLVTSQRLELTMVKSGSSWLASNLSQVGAS